MTDRKVMPKWLAYYYQQVEVRNQSQSSAFRELITNYSEVLNRCRTLEDQARTLEREKMAAKALT
jgi:hypothetical protein